jgi:hypothetical protein
VRIELYGGPGDGKIVECASDEYLDPRASLRGGNNAHGFPTVIRRVAHYVLTFHPYAKRPDGTMPKLVLMYRGERSG